MPVGVLAFLQSISSGFIIIPLLGVLEAIAIGKAFGESLCWT